MFVEGRPHQRLDMLFSSSASRRFVGAKVLRADLQLVHFAQDLIKTNESSFSCPISTVNSQNLMTISDWTRIARLRAKHSRADKISRQLAISFQIKRLDCTVSESEPKAAAVGVLPATVRKKCRDFCLTTGTGYEVLAPSNSSRWAWQTPASEALGELSHRDG